MSVLSTFIAIYFSISTVLFETSTKFLYISTVVVGRGGVH